MIIYSYNLIVFNTTIQENDFFHKEIAKFSEDYSGIKKKEIMTISFKTVLLPDEIVDYLKLDDIKYILHEINDRNSKTNVFIPTLNDVINENFTEEEQLKLIYNEIDELSEDEIIVEIDKILSTKITEFDKKILLYLNTSKNNKRA